MQHNRPIIIYNYCILQLLSYTACVDPSGLGSFCLLSFHLLKTNHCVILLTQKNKYRITIKYYTTTDSLGVDNDYVDCKG